MRIGLIQTFVVMLPSDRFAASSPPRGEPDIVHELTTQDTRGLSQFVASVTFADTEGPCLIHALAEFYRRPCCSSTLCGTTSSGASHYPETSTEHTQPHCPQYELQNLASLSIRLEATPSCVVDSLHIAWKMHSGPLTCGAAVFVASSLSAPHLRHASLPGQEIFQACPCARQHVTVPITQ